MSDYRRDLGLDIGFIDHFNTTRNYIAPSLISSLYKSLLHTSVLSLLLYVSW
jgi:hypothetical protein